MEQNRDTPMERLLARLWRDTARDRLPFFSALVFGLAAHMFAFANKLVNADEIESLFGKGATVTSGRWGLEAIKLLFPDYSMPWLYGLVSLLLLSLAVCLIVRLFEIRGGLSQVLLAGMITAFPAQTGAFCFMFTSAPYALAFLLSVLSVYCFARKTPACTAAAGLCLVLSLGIYQAYIAVTASFFVLLLIRRCMEGQERAGKTLLFGVKALGLMLVSLAVYAAVTLAVFRFTGTEFNDYVRDHTNALSLAGRVRMALDFFVYYLSYREFALVTGEASRAVHLVCLLLCAAGLGLAAVKRLRAKDLSGALLLLGCGALLPLAVNCMFLAMDKSSIHTLVIYSFVAFYVLAVMLLERVFAGAALWRRLSRDVIYLSLAVALLSNVYFANGVYLKMYLQYENAYSFYSILLSRAQRLEGYGEDTKLALIGTQDNTLTRFDEIDVGYIMGPSHDLVNIYSRENFLRRYLGTEIPLASEQELAALAATEEFAAMAEYPYEGSVKMIDGYAAVKLG